MLFGDCDGKAGGEGIQAFLKSRRRVGKGVIWLLGLIMEGDSARQSKAPEVLNLPMME